MMNGAIVPAMLVHASAAAAAAAVIVVGVGAARAGDADQAGTRLALGGVEVRGDAEAPLAVALRRAAQAGLPGTTAQVAPDEVKKLLEAVPDLAGCASAACLTRFAASTGATRVIAVEAAVEGELYQLVVKLTDDQGRALRHRATDCVACSMSEVQEKVTALVNDVVTARGDDVVPVVVATDPGGLTLTIDGEDAGRAPWRGSLTAGTHQVVTTDAERQIRSDTFVVEAGSDGRITVQVPGATPPRRTWGPRRWIVAGSGAALFVSGLVLLAKDGDGTCDAASCPEEYETRLGGWTAVTLGVAAGAFAGWMFWQDHRGVERPRWALIPSERGVTATVSGRF